MRVCFCIILVVAALRYAYCAERNAMTKNGGTQFSSLLFDACGTDPKPWKEYDVSRFPSCSGKYLAIVMYPKDRDLDFEKRLVVKDSFGNELLLGRNEYVISVNWHKTQIGDVLVVKDRWDAHFEQLHFVLFPDNDVFKYVALYSTPRTFCPKVGNNKYAPYDIQAKLVEFKETGVVTIKMSWGFSNIDGNKGGDVTFSMPLFYGFGSGTDSH